MGNFLTFLNVLYHGINVPSCLPARILPFRPTPINATSQVQAPTGPSSESMSRLLRQAYSVSSPSTSFTVSSKDTTFCSSTLTSSTPVFIVLQSASR